LVKEELLDYLKRKEINRYREIIKVLNIENNHIKRCVSASFFSIRIFENKRFKVGFHWVRAFCNQTTQLEPMFNNRIKFMIPQLFVESIDLGDGRNITIETGR
jgi:hypothetical protein